MAKKAIFQGRNGILMLCIFTLFCGNVLAACQLVRAASFSTETDLTLSATTATAGETVELDAYVWAAGTMLIPRGTVFFSDGDFSIYTWSVEVSIAESGPDIGHAKYTWNIPEDWNGVTTIYARYRGDDNFDPSEDTADITIDDGRYTTSCELFLSTNSGYPTETATLEVKVTNEESSEIPSGEVQFWDDTYNDLLGTVSLNVSGGAPFSWQVSESYPEGVITLKAEYQGTTSFNPSEDSEDFTILGRVAPIVDITLLPDTIAVGEEVHIAATVWSGEIVVIPTGTVAFFVDEDDTLIGEASLDVAGDGTIDWTAPSRYAEFMGTSIMIRGEYSGDMFFNPVTASTELEIEETIYSTETDLTLTPSAGTPGSSITIEAEVAALLTDVSPEGDVAFRDITNGQTLGTSPCDDEGIATLAWQIPSAQIPQELTLRAEYLGDAFGMFLPSEEEKSLLVEPFSSITSVIVSPSSTWAGETVDIQAEVTGVGTTKIPTGTVTLKDELNDIIIETLVLDSAATCQTTWTVPSGSTGTLEISAMYEGSSWFYPALGSAYIDVSSDSSAPQITVNVEEHEVLSGNVEIHVTVDDETSISQLFINEEEFDSATASYTLRTMDYSDGPFNLVIRAIDDFDNEEILIRKLIIDNTPPEIEDVGVKDGKVASGTIKFEFEAEDTTDVTWFINGKKISEDSYKLDTNTLPDGENEVEIQVEDEAGHRTDTSVTLWVDNTRPSIVVEYNPHTQSMTIKVEDAHLYVTNVYANETLFKQFMHDQDVSTESFEVSFASNPHGTYQIIVDSKDKVDNLGTERYTLVLKEPTMETTTEPLTTSESVNLEETTTSSTSSTIPNSTSDAPITSEESSPTETALPNTTIPAETTTPAGPPPLISKNSLSIPVLIMGAAGIVLVVIRQSGLLNGGIRRLSRGFNGRHQE